MVLNGIKNDGYAPRSTFTESIVETKFNGLGMVYDKFELQIQIFATLNLFSLQSCAETRMPDMARTQIFINIRSLPLFTFPCIACKWEALLKRLSKF